MLFSMQALTNGLNESEQDSGLDVEVNPIINSDNHLTGGSGGNQRQSSNNTVIVAGHERAVRPVSSAASIFPAICFNGVSGQGKDFAFSVSTESPVCKYYEGAKQSLRAYERAVARCEPISCTVECKDKDVWTEAQISSCQVQANKYLADYEANMATAQELLEDGIFWDKVDAIFWGAVKWLFIGKVL